MTTKAEDDPVAIEGEMAPSPVMQVIEGGYCIGCGACAAVSGSPMTIEMNHHGLMMAHMVSANGDPEMVGAASRVCPFSSNAQNESEIAASHFASNCQLDDSVGYYQEIYAGRVKDSSSFAAGSSGGIGRWILAELLRQDLVDGVISVSRCEPGSSSGGLYNYTFASTPEEVLQGAQSAYHPVEMSSVLADLRSRAGRYAITGVPCFIKALRLLCQEDSTYRERILFCVGLICGHLKSKRYAEMLGWQLGVPPHELGRLDFRRKLVGRNAKEKGVAAYSLRQPEAPCGVDIVQNLYGTDYSLGLFKPKACDFCDDVFAETADVVVGDAWLPDYLEKGTSLVVTRHPVIADLVRTGIKDGRLELDTLSVEDAAQSQAGGLRHRREGLQYRLHLAGQAGEWCPKKRVEPSSEHLSKGLRRKYRLRMKIARKSHAAFIEAIKVGSFMRFVRLMNPLVQAHKGKRKRSRKWRRVRKLLSAMASCANARRIG